MSLLFYVGLTADVFVLVGRIQQLSG